MRRKPIANSEWLLVVALLGCGQAHRAVPDAGDAGPPEFDLGPWLVDGGPEVLPPPCSAGESCPSNNSCINEAVCRSWERVSEDDFSVSIPMCVFGPGDIRSGATFTGEPCGLAEPEAMHGVGVPLSLCLALVDPDDPVHTTYAPVFQGGCVWSDGTPVTQRAPDTPCPGIEPTAATNYFPVLRFCGGTCGRGGCTDLFTEYFSHDCVGRSDSRSFGVCAADGVRCSASNVGSVLHNVCSYGYREEWLGADATCLCMVTQPQPDWAEEELGWVVPARSCLEYQRAFPDSVDCRDEEYERVPTPP